MNIVVAPPFGKREQTKARNRETILAAAKRVFADKGYEAATVRDIIRGTDLASGTFYNYFRSKEEIARLRSPPTRPSGCGRCCASNGCMRRIFRTISTAF